MVPAGNKAERLSLVNHSAKTVHHHYHQLKSDDFFYKKFLPGVKKIREVIRAEKMKKAKARKEIK